MYPIEDENNKIYRFKWKGACFNFESKIQVVTGRHFIYWFYQDFFPGMDWDTPASMAWNIGRITSSFSPGLALEMDQKSHQAFVQQRYQAFKLILPAGCRPAGRFLDYCQHGSGYLNLA
jgi:hypothetical protein